MNTQVTRNATLTTSLTASVDGVKTLGDTECAVQSMFGEGVPRDSVISMYADRNATLKFHIEYDNTSALAELRDRMVSYLEATIETEERSGYKAATERDLIAQITTILEGI